MHLLKIIPDHEKLPLVPVNIFNSVDTVIVNRSNKVNPWSVHFNFELFDRIRYINV